MSRARARALAILAASATWAALVMAIAFGTVALVDAYGSPDPQGDSVVLATILGIPAGAASVVVGLIVYERYRP